MATLERAGLIRRQPGVARRSQLLVDPNIRRPPQQSQNRSVKISVQAAQAWVEAGISVRSALQITLFDAGTLPLRTGPVRKPMRSFRVPWCARHDRFT